ncbi:MAG TPA: Smr/MutS family protein [Pseudorhodoplanes sp.]|nr:Smr/MutS family protein [Pseudorhodoplanes sp.]
MTRKGRTLSGEERALWDGVTRSIMPLRRPRVKAAEADEDAPRQPWSAVPAKPAADPAPSRTKQPPLAPLDRRLKKRLRRGRQEIDARIDLHGDTQAQAHARLRRFLRASQDEGAAMVLVITGKGGRGGREGVLRRQVPLWLGLPELREYVIGFDVASGEHGGEGALYVRLRRKRRSG